MKKIEDYNKCITSIRIELTKYIMKYNLKSLILGVSGGIDSALVASLAEPVCSAVNIPLIGRSLPSYTNKKEEIDRADLVCKAFCTEYKIVSIDSMYDFFKNWIDGKSELISLESNDGKIQRGNLKARIRMIYLYNLAFKMKGMVLSTDNLTEYLLSYFTVHGDVGDFGMIQNLLKTEVYEMSKCLVEGYINNHRMSKACALQSTIDCIPTDGNGITSSDIEAFGTKSYDEVDEIFWKTKFVNNVDISKAIVDNEKEFKSNVYNRHINTEWKRNLPINIPREILEV